MRKEDSKKIPRYFINTVVIAHERVIIVFEGLSSEKGSKIDDKYVGEISKEKGSQLQLILDEAVTALPKRIQAASSNKATYLAHEVDFMVGNSTRSFMFPQSHNGKD